MNTKRIEELMKETAYPESHSVMQALLQVWNELQQAFNKQICDNCKHFSLLDMNGQPDEEFGFGYCEEKVRDASKGFGCNRWKAKN